MTDSVATGEASLHPPLTLLTQLAGRAGILPRYLDQTGREWRETSDDTRRALLAALGIDASSDEAVAAALARLDADARDERLAPVRVVEQAESACVQFVLGDRPVLWSLEVELESGDRVRVSGSARESGPVAVPLPNALPLGYHRVRLWMDGAPDEAQQRHEQTLIVVPSRAVTPDAVIGDGAFGLIANLYTLRSDANWGVGDFSDLATLAEWGAAHGADFVGVNPLHALLNRGYDISPYSPVSRLFRNPLYVDVTRVPELACAPEIAARLASPEFGAELEALRHTADVKYDQVIGVKGLALDALHRVFEERVRGSNSDRDRAYAEYVDQNEPRLTRFATWMAIAEVQPRNTQGDGYDWRVWPEALRQPHLPAVVSFASEHASRVDFHRWVQFETDRQLGDAADRARAAGMRIGVYQDLAIGSSPAGADTWAYPELFVRGVSVGAPPDPYAQQGQNWGLPPVDPRALRRTAYRYFIDLLRAGFRHGGALRIDHIIGLFRLFWIPDGVSGEHGAYVQYPASDLLGIIALESVRHRALVVGEDLGTVPEGVSAALEKWGLLSSRVLLFERENDGAFKPPVAYPRLSLATATTHDMAPLAGFWEGRDIDIRRDVGLVPHEDDVHRARDAREGERQALLHALANADVLGRPEAMSLADLRGAVHAYLCRSPAALVGLSLDDLAGELQPVNVPGVGADRHPSWTRKMRATLEVLAASDDVRAAFRHDGRTRNTEP